MTRRTWLSLALLGTLVGMVFITVLVAPAAEKGRPYSSHSASIDGVRLARDLSGRLGWKPESRTVAFSDTLTGPAPIQVLIQARVSASEARALLDFVRQGGSLLVAGAAGALDDSLAVVTNATGEPVEAPPTAECSDRNVWQTQLAHVARIAIVAWRRPAPPDTVGFGRVGYRRDGDPTENIGRAAVGFPFGRGRVVAVADENYLVNDVVRRCELEADVAFVRMIEYLSRGERGRRIAFDEFHHGYGVRGGSFTAIRMYLAGTPSGRMLAQIAVAGLLLLFAFAPRPLVPRDPVRAIRRSPLEHADALAHAYAGVNATRTVTARLLAGVRRRTRRDRSRFRDTDEQLLGAAAATSAQAATAAGVVSNALGAPVAERELTQVAGALETIEQALTQRITSPTR